MNGLPENYVGYVFRECKVCGARRISNVVDGERYGQMSPEQAEEEHNTLTWCNSCRRETMFCEYKR